MSDTCPSVFTLPVSMLSSVSFDGALFSPRSRYETFKNKVSHPCVQSLGAPGGRQDGLGADHRQQPRGGLRQLHLHRARPRPVRQPRDHHPTGIRVLRELIRPRISGGARGPKPSIILQMPNSQILTTTTNGGRENSQSRVIIWTICIRKRFCNLVPFTLSRPRP